MRLLLALPLLVLAGCAPDADAPEAPADTFEPNAGPETVAAGADVATAVVQGLDGADASGVVTFRRVDGATHVRIRLTGLAPGAHGFHVHEGGSCGPDSTGTPGGAAGGHFNPLVSEHGAPSNPPSSRHVGDLGNVMADADGLAEGSVVDSVLTLAGPTSVIGHAVVVHAGQDDLTSQPSGAAGARVACGVVREGRAGAAEREAEA